MLEKRQFRPGISYATEDELLFAIAIGERAKILGYQMISGE
jgi:hypothetical protein